MSSGRVRAMWPAGLTSARWQVLAAVEETPLSAAQIARAMNLTRQSVQHVADFLVDDGLCVYEDNPAQARAKLLRLDEDQLRTASAVLAQLRLIGGTR